MFGSVEPPKVFVLRSKGLLPPPGEYRDCGCGIVSWF